jgi:ankyrin repeat protein
MRWLPARPNLEHLKKEAKAQLKAIRRTDPKTKLTAAQLSIARAYGFSSWRALKAHVDSQATTANTATAVAPPPVKVRVSDWKPLMDACLAGDAEWARKLLDGGADPNVMSTTPHRYRPLHRAIEHKKTMPKHEGHDEVVKLLLERGADPKLRGVHEKYTTLQLAAIGETRFVPLLRKRFEPLDIFHASVLGQETRVAALLKQDRSLATARDSNTFTPLHYCAASAMHRESEEQSQALARIAQMLLDAGADPMAAYNYNDEWPLRPMYFAAGWSNNPAVTKILLDAGADPCDGESIYHAADEGHKECLALFERHVDPKKLARAATSALPAQLHWRRTAGMKWLLEHGADPNVPNKHFGNAALHEAVIAGLSDKVVKVLLHHGAKATVKNHQGKSAIQLAREAGKTKLLKLLE